MSTGWPKKTGPVCFIANILKTPRPNCVEILRVLACLFTHYRFVWWRHTWRHSFIYFRSHTARDTVRYSYLQRNNVAFIEPDVWPPNSPANYAVWGALQQLVYKHRSFTSVAELKQAIINAWQELSQSFIDCLLFIDRSINEWRRRLECVVHQNEGHIKHLFK